MQLNNPFGDNYPFIGPPMDDPSTPKVVYDAYITYYVPSLQYKLPLRLVYIHPRGRYQIKIVDADNTVVFNSHVSTSTWGEDYTIYQGHAAGVSVSVITKGDSPYAPEHGELCLRCVYTQPKHVTSIVTNNISLSPNILIDAGYNIEYSLDRDSDELRPATLITIDANPGAGLGRVPVDCTQTIEHPITSINGVSPDDGGSIYLDGANATKASQSGINSITVADDTTPCCYCEDFTYLAEILDKHITNHYVMGATAEAARDSLKELVELFECGSLDIIKCKQFKPVRLYVDNSWERFLIVTVEVRNIFPALMKDLCVFVDVGTRMEDFTPLRTYVPTELVPDKAPLDSQLSNHSGITRQVSATSFSVNWGSYTLEPGMTVWSTIRFRNGSACKASSESVQLHANATFRLVKTGCVKQECLEDLDIDYTATESTVIGGGYGWNDPSGKSQDTPTHGSDGALDCMVERVYEICKEEHPDRG